MNCYNVRRVLCTLHIAVEQKGCMGGQKEPTSPSLPRRDEVNSHRPGGGGRGRGSLPPPSGQQEFTSSRWWGGISLYLTPPYPYQYLHSSSKTHAHKTRTEQNTDTYVHKITNVPVFYIGRLDIIHVGTLIVNYRFCLTGEVRSWYWQPGQQTSCVSWPISWPISVQTNRFTSRGSSHSTSKMWAFICS